MVEAVEGYTAVVRFTWLESHQRGSPASVVDTVWPRFRRPRRVLIDEVAVVAALCQSPTFGRTLSTQFPIDLAAEVPVGIVFERVSVAFFECLAGVEMNTSKNSSQCVVRWKIFVAQKNPQRVDSICDSSPCCARTRPGNRSHGSPRASMEPNQLPVQRCRSHGLTPNRHVIRFATVCSVQSDNRTAENAWAPL